MNTTDRRDEIVEAEAHSEERMNIHQETIEIIGKEKTEINIGINQMKIRTTILAPPTPEITIIVIVNEKLQPPLLEISLFNLMREEKIILNPKLGISSKTMKVIMKNRSSKNL